MTNVMKGLKNNSIIILFAMVILVSTVYMGVSERKLAESNQTVIVK